MNELSDLAKSPFNWKANGKTYEFSPLTFKDQGDFLRFVQFEPYRVAKSQVTTPTDVDVAVLEKIFRSCFNGNPMANIDGVLQTTEGMVEILYLSARHNSPKITRNELATLLGTPQDAKHIIEAIMKLSGLETGAEKKVENQQAEAQA